MSSQIVRLSTINKVGQICSIDDRRPLNSGFQELFEELCLRMAGAEGIEPATHHLKTERQIHNILF